MNRAAPASSLRLTGAWTAVNSRQAVRADVEIANGRIHRVTPPGGIEDGAHSVNVDLAGYLILPGLINAHDHLEFNLFPRLGSGPYANYEEWAGDIYRPDRSPIREHLSVPKPIRLLWGGLKNLLAGVTTVCQHNPYEEEVFGRDFPVHVVERYGWAHSLAFEKNLLRAFRSTEAGAPFIIHLGEGTDGKSENEIFALDQLGALDSRTVIVHGVGLTPEGHALRKRRGAALVWCPTSNRFTIGATLDARSICREEVIALGNDSALTAQGDLLREIRAAHVEDGVSADALYSMVTDSAANILRLTNGEGTLRPGSAADLIAIRWKNSTPAETLVGADLGDIEMVVVSGRVNLVSASLAPSWPEALRQGLDRIIVEGAPRWVRAPMRQMRTAGESIAGGLRLAGREVVV